MISGGKRWRLKVSGLIRSRYRPRRANSTLLVWQCRAGFLLPMPIITTRRGRTCLAEGCTVTASRSANWCRDRHTSSWWITSPIRPDMIFGRDRCPRDHSGQAGLLKATKQPLIGSADLIRGLPHLNPWSSIVLAARKAGVMQIQADTEVSLFVRSQVTGRLVFNSKAIEALGLQPTELAQRGYPLDGEVASPAIVPVDGPVSTADNG